MFKLATFLRSDGASIDPLTCDHIRVYLSDNVIIMNRKMFDSMHGSISKIRVAATIVIGEGSYVNVTFVKDFRECLRHVSKYYQDRSWWIIGDNAMANDLIWKGLIMDVHLSKCYAQPGTREWDNRTSNIIDQSVMFDMSLIGRIDMGFSLLSNVKVSRTKKIRHYLRRNHEELALLSAMHHTVKTGHNRPNRTGVNTRALFGQHFEYKMVERVDPNTGKSAYRLPLLTTKHMFTRGVFEELKWFLNGCTDSKVLERRGVHIWKGNTSRAFLDSVGLKHFKEGECGPIYGHQWRHWGAKWVSSKSDYAGEGIDQVANVIESLQTDPYSRRHIITAWNVEDLDKMCLPPCHHTFQFMVSEGEGQKYLSLFLYQRSCDVFLGLPFNICSLGMFLTIVAHRVNMKPHTLYHSIADFHIYETHIEATAKQIQREPCVFPYISIKCDKPKDKLEDYNFSDIVIEDYYHHSAIKANMVA